MKKIIFGILITLMSSAFASGYTFECSNKDGSIKIFEQGNSVKVYDNLYSSIIILADVEIWAPLDNAEVKVVKNGKRYVLHKETINACRESGTSSFAQKLTLKLSKSGKVIAEDYFICENTFATTSGGSDCGVDFFEQL